MSKTERKTYARNYMRKRIKEAAKAGVCWRCKDEAVNPGKKTPLCAEHLVYMRQVMRERRGSSPWVKGKPGRPPRFEDSIGLESMSLEA